ncbi:hypothetical protein [Burkholderia phage FLC9]|nr:hypothetical protein [Burkholderia phage FLC9]
MQAEDYDKIKPLVLIPPVDIPVEFRLMDGHVFMNMFGDIRNWLHDYAYFDKDRDTFDEILKHHMDLIELGYLEGPGYDYSLMNRLRWRVRFQDVYGNDQLSIRERFVSFTAILDPVLDKKKAAELSSWIVRTADQEGLDMSKFNNGIIHTFGFRMHVGHFKRVRADEMDFGAMGITSDDFYNEEARISPDWAALLCSAFPINDQNKEPEVSEQQAAPAAEQESDGKKPTTYYGRHDLSMLLQETADPADLINVEKFIDDNLTSWSKHLALNTHKKQTDKTPRFSIHEGPGIITILLDRGDLEFGERAPQLQMIFTDGDGGIAITPRQQGGMTTSRMLDAFDQILLELNSDKRVPFKQVDSLVTFVDHVSDHNDSLAFREAIGDPKQALILHGIEEPDVVFYMYRIPNKEKKVAVEAHFNKRDGSEPGILFTIWLDDVGHQGNLMLKIAEDSPKQPALALNTRRVSSDVVNGELVSGEGANAELAPVWEEVRSTPADPDSVLEKHPKPVSMGKLKEALDQATKISEFKLSGSDQAMLKHVMDRFRNEGNLSNLDLMSLDAAQNFIFAGGLLNVAGWSYEASLTGARTEEDLSLLRGDNNAYIIILADGSNVPVLTYQCKVSDAAQQ